VLSEWHLELSGHILEDNLHQEMGLRWTVIKNQHQYFTCKAHTYIWRQDNKWRRQFQLRNIKRLVEEICWVELIQSHRPRSSSLRLRCSLSWTTQSYLPHSLRDPPHASRRHSRTGISSIRSLVATQTQRCRLAI
jgi:hypothetical protein